MKRICIGTAQFGMNYGVANRLGKPAPEVVLRIVDTALKNGVLYFDTAASYGTSETVLGDVFEQLGIQHKVRIITKLPGNYRYHNDNELKRIVYERMDSLKVSKLHALLFHNADQLKGNAKIERSLNRLKKKDLVSNVGVSIYEPEDAIYFADRPDIDVIQVPFNVMDGRLLDNGFFDLAEKNKKQVFIRSVYLQGLLLMTPIQIQNAGMKWALDDLKILNDYVTGAGCDIKKFAVSAVRASVPKAVMIFGVDSKKQLEENLDMLRACKDIPNEIHENWWKCKPEFPRRLKNPSLW